jgi:hypothetical protein
MQWTVDKTAPRPTPNSDAAHLRLDHPTHRSSHSSHQNAINITASGQTLNEVSDDSEIFGRLLSAERFHQYSESGTAAATSATITLELALCVLSSMKTAWSGRDLSIFSSGASLDRVSCTADWRRKVTTVIAAPAEAKATRHALGSSRNKVARHAATKGRRDQSVWGGRKCCTPIRISRMRRFGPRRSGKEIGHSRSDAGSS